MRWEEHVAMRKRPRPCEWCGGWYYAQAATTRTHATPCGGLLKAAEAMGLSREEYAAHRGIVIVRRDDPPPAGALSWPVAVATPGVPAPGAVVRDSGKQNVGTTAEVPTKCHDHERQLAELRAANNRLLRDNEKQRISRAELVEAVYRAAETAFSALDVKPVKPPRPDLRSGTPEIAICVLSDWQPGKATASYSSEVCRKRIDLYAQKVRKITEMRRSDHPVPECRIYVLGDMLEGEMIFPGQGWRVDASLFRQLCVDGPDILGGFIRQMLAYFERVRVVAVPGNHGRVGGRAGKESHPETNADLMLYEIVRRELRSEPRIEWGEQAARVEEFFSERTSYRPFHYAFAGHFHTENKMAVNGVKFWASPSTESGNEYAASELASASEPGQLLLFAHPRRGIVAESCITLWEDEEEPAA